MKSNAAFSMQVVFVLTLTLAATMSYAAFEARHMNGHYDILAALTIVDGDE